MLLLDCGVLPGAIFLIVIGGVLIRIAEPPAEGPISEDIGHAFGCIGVRIGVSFFYFFQSFVKLVRVRPFLNA
ncbi:hypothetical protein D3C81_2119710 [compost metagenome]